MPRRSFERWVAVLNVVVLLVGSTLAWFEWFPKMTSEMHAARVGEQTPTTPASTVKIEDTGAMPDGSHLYQIDFDVTVKNSSDNPVSISYSVALLYLAAAGAKPPALDHALTLNDPPNPWDESPKGGLDWRQITYDASLIDGKTPAKVEAFFHQHGYVGATRGGGLTGVVAPGDTTGSTPRFILRAYPGQYVGLVLAYGLGDAVQSPSPNINLVSDIRRLDVTPPKTGVGDMCSPLQSRLDCPPPPSSSRLSPR